MKRIKVAAGVLNQTPLDWDGNRDRIVEAIRQARERGASILCLPELCVTGYGCEDMYDAPGVVDTALETLGEILPHTKGIVVSLGVPAYRSGGIFNFACLAADGVLLGMVGKQNLAGDGIHYEPRWFKPWPEGIATTLPLHGDDVPIGDLIFDVGGIRIGFEVCEDAWVGQRPGAKLAARGVDVILNPSASHFAFDKYDIRRRFVLEGSRAFQAAYVYANLVGNESGRAIFDGDAMIASGGRLLANGMRFSYRDVGVVDAIVDIDENRLGRSRSSSFRPMLGSETGAVVRAEFAFPAKLEPSEDQGAEPWEASADRKEVEFTRAVSLALFDYARKSRSKGFVVSLSGGADSAACAALSSLSVAYALDELGAQETKRKLAYWKELQSASPGERAAEGSPTAIGPRLAAWGPIVLQTVYQATRNSSDVTRNAAKATAEAIGADHLEFDVDAAVENYRATVEQAIGRKLTWEQDDVALQNIQARVRAPGVWMLANLRGALLLATSNRSEAAVGYTTMDGDCAGGLSPIAGIDKAFLRRWLRWLEANGPPGYAPIDALRLINVQQPTAELRPLERNQTDEGDLMPYDLLDRIERLAIRDKLLPVEAYERLLEEYPRYTADDLLVWTERFFRKWCQNQWKRERYAPSFHLDDENLDPKTWCRFPILSGGYERELRELHEWKAANVPVGR
jgi:NAD+ synthase (glutamine-hydrolysing)